MCVMSLTIRHHQLRHYSAQSSPSHVTCCKVHRPLPLSVTLITPATIPRTIFIARVGPVNLINVKQRQVAAWSQTKSVVLQSTSIAVVDVKC